MKQYFLFKVVLYSTEDGINRLCSSNVCNRGCDGGPEGVNYGCNPPKSTYHGAVNVGCNLATNC
jgi:hypothetical protein